jgi:hypothetical protein
MQIRGRSSGKGRERKGSRGRKRRQRKERIAAGES